MVTQNDRSPFPFLYFFPHSQFYVQEIPTMRHKAAVNNSKKKTIDDTVCVCVCARVNLEIINVFC